MIVIKFHNISQDDMLNGPGLRTVLWLSGCAHNCPGCHNPITHDPEDGLIFDDAAQEELLGKLSKDYISGLTVSGGDSLFPGNRRGVRDLLLTVRSALPGKTIWLYTGYTWEQLMREEDFILSDILSMTDVLADGPFVQKLLDVNYPYVGSRNQRLIDVQQSLKKGGVVLYEPESLT